MTELIQRKLSDSAVARWSVLGLVAFTMMCGYFITDMMAPLQDLLQHSVETGGLGWSANDYGTFTSAYGWFNVFFLMLIFGGMILDKMGVRFTGLMASALMIVGVAIKWYGVTHDFGGASINIIGNLGEFFRTAKPEIKILLLGSIFPRKIEFDGKIIEPGHITGCLMLSIRKPIYYKERKI